MLRSIVVLCLRCFNIKLHFSSHVIASNGHNYSLENWNFEHFIKRCNELKFAMDDFHRNAIWFDPADHCSASATLASVETSSSSGSHQKTASVSSLPSHSLCQPMLNLVL